MILRLISLSTLAILLGCSGCGTISNLKHERQVYGGVRGDCQVVSQYFAEGFGPKPKAGGDLRALYLAIGALGAIDLPLSAAADSVTLPVTIAAIYQSERSHQKKGS